MTFNNVCRLCLAKNNLGWIFDEKNENLKMKDVIYIATGIEVGIKDVISQQICDNCYQFTIKIFQFKSQCLKNDIYLKESCRKYLEDAVVFVPNSQITIKKDVKKNQAPRNKLSYTIHPSVTEICKIYPQIKLPGLCLKSHVAPVVCMELDQVENYFKDQKLDISEYIQHALKSSSISKESAKPKHCNSLEEDNALSNRTQNNKVDKKYTENVRMANNNKTLNDSYITTNRSESKIQDNKKRKLLESEEFSSKKFKETVSKETVHKNLPTSPLGKNDSEPLSYVDKLVPLHVCNICNSVHYSIKDLKKHQNSHMRCQFCKTRFRTIQHKNHHIENLCIVKNTMSNLPNIILEKIEHNRNIRCKYPEAFYSFQSLEGSNKSGLSDCASGEVIKSVEISPTEIIKTVVTRSSVPELEKQITESSAPSERLIIIEIYSDEEESTDIPANRNPNQENLKDKTSLLIKPDINIKNNHLLDHLDLTVSDIKIIKELFDKSELHLFSQKHTQTDLYMNTNIIQSSMTIALKDLVQHLYVYKIPVVPKYGKFKVSYGLHVNTERTKKLFLWNNLAPIDIKPVRNKNSAESVINAVPNTKLGISHSQPVQSNQPQNIPETTSENKEKSLNLPLLPHERIVLQRQIQVSTKGLIRVKKIDELL